MFRNYTKYEVYEDGKIWSYSRNKFLKQVTDTNGYKVVCLSNNDGKIKKYLVHRVVYESVTSEPIPEGFDVNHRNEVKTDNRFANLNLMTRKQNINWGSANERRAKAISKANTNNPKLSKQVGAFKDGKLVMTFPSANEARRQGFNQGNVSMCCRNCYMREGNNVFKGYEWKYI